MLKSLGKMFGLLTGKPAGADLVFHPTDTCPECGSKLFTSAGWGERPREPLAAPPDGSPGVSPHQPEWRCPNPDCPPQVRLRLEHWCSPEAMDIAGGDAAMVEKLVASGLVRDPAEFYRLKVKELVALPGMDKDAAQKIFDAITASMKRDAWRVLFGLAIPHVGAEEAKTLCKSFRALDDLFAAGRERIQNTSGVSELVARSVAHWYGDPVNRRLVTRLFKAGVNFKSAIHEATHKTSDTKTPP